MVLEEGRSQEAGNSSEKLLAHHKENHFTAGEIIRDIIIGVSDGLTVPFALSAGLSGAAVPSSLILTAGLAEVAAGAISMGLAGYLAAKSEADHYVREYKREQDEIISVPETEAAEVGDILAECGLQPHEYGPIVKALRRNPQAWLDFMMKLCRIEDVGMLFTVILSHQLRDSPSMREHRGLTFLTRGGDRGSCYMLMRLPKFWRVEGHVASCGYFEEKVVTTFDELTRRSRS